jgi:hypothetical protein
MKIPPKEIQFKFIKHFRRHPRCVLCEFETWSISIRTSRAAARAESGHEHQVEIVFVADSLINYLVCGAVMGKIFQFQHHGKPS